MCTLKIHRLKYVITGIRNSAFEANNTASLYFILINVIQNWTMNPDLSFISDFICWFYPTIHMPGYYNRTHILLRKQEKKNKNFDNFTPFWGYLWFFEVGTYHNLGLGILDFGYSIRTAHHPSLNSQPEDNFLFVFPENRYFIVRFNLDQFLLSL